MRMSGVREREKEKRVEIKGDKTKRERKKEIKKTKTNVVEGSMHLYAQAAFSPEKA